MNVLFLSQRVPYPPDRGDRITTYHFLQHFRGLGASIRVGCLAEEERDAESVAALRGMVDDVCAPRIHRPWRRLRSLTGLCTGRPLTLPFFDHSGLRRTVDGWIRESAPDLVYVYSSSMAQYVMRHPGLFRFMQFAELDSDKWRQFAEVRRGVGAWIYRREAARLLRFERRIAQTFDACAVVSDVEKALFMERIPDVTPLVMRNGVDVGHFVTSGDANRDPHTAIFTGVMDYEPNVQGVLWFVGTCWPDIRRAVPDATLLVVGSRPVEAIRNLNGRDGVRVLGRVPSMPPHMDRAAVAIAPLKLARGVQNKVLEAMSAALPVVATTEAAQGLGDVDAGALTIADGAAETVQAILALFSDSGAARRMGGHAAAFVREHFRWEDQYGEFDRVVSGRLDAAARASARGTVDRAPVSGGGTRSAP